MIFENNGYYYNINKDIYEPDDLYYKRVWFIIKLKPKNINELNNYIHYSILWKNIKFLGCVYNEQIHSKIQELEINID
jgi:hypothetical protein